jgi:ElaB/YqjD/DUF883 family membrane-anchored ribosome-binding protein
MGTALTTQRKERSMTTEQTSGRPGGAVAEMKDKGEELVSSTQEQLSTKTHELSEDASFQVREQLDQRSTQAGEQLQSIGKTLQSGANQLRSEGKDVPARVVEEVARRADDVGSYLQSSEADRILGDIEAFARRRPWLTAGVGALAGFVASRFVKASGDRRYEGAHSNGSGYSPSMRSLTSGGA